MVVVTLPCLWAFPFEIPSLSGRDLAAPVGSYPTLHSPVGARVGLGYERPMVEVRQLSNSGYGFLEATPEIERAIQSWSSPSPLRAERGIPEHMGRRAKLLDLTTIYSCDLPSQYCLSRRGRKAMEPYLTDVDLLELETDSGPYFVMRMPLLDDVLGDGCEFEMWENPPPRVRRVVKYDFKPERVLPFFRVKLPNSTRSRTFIRGDVADAVIERKLKGFSSVRIWPR